MKHNLVIFNRIKSGAIYNFRLTKKCSEIFWYNVSLFTTYSKRLATTSKATASVLSVIEVLERGTCLNMSTWQKFYKNYIIPIRV